MADKILIIDDDIDTLKLVGMMLQRQGYEIVAAASGAQGLTLAEREVPDIILLDVMMPQMDGYEVARRLRANPETSPIPILMFTARNQIEDKVAGFESGADSYLSKPAHPVEVQAQVRSLLTRAKERPRRPTTPAETPAYSIGVISARGGSGVTSVALNLAAALGTLTKGEIILAELRPGQGSLAIDLGLSPSKTLSELLNLQPKQITRPRVREVLVSHPCGLELLFASFQPRDLSLIENTDQFEALAQRLTYMAQFVVYDLGAGLTSLSQKLASDFCSELLIILEPVPGAIPHARALLEDLISLGINKDHLSFIANDRGAHKQPMTPAQLEQQLGQPLAARLAAADDLFSEAAQSHAIPVLLETENPARQQYLELAEQIFDRAPAPR